MDAEKVRPGRNFCLVKVEGRDQAILGGLLYLPNSETTSEKLSQGVGSVIRIGPSNKTGPLGIKVGDRIAYRGYLKHATRIEDDDREKEYMVLHLDDVIAVIDKDISVGVFSSPVTHARPALQENK